MDPGFINEVGREAIYVIIMMSAPVLIIALLVGLMISLFQALTQIQETTLTFVPKIIAVYFSMLFIMPYMFGKLKIFVDHIMQH
ncbi:flagellar biosynthesis protein FliQ, partial [Rickettsiaceae bacterium]|nr:flagellar biosynthesis protein FliQ [Rickettsiaceae bacterium]